MDAIPVIPTDRGDNWTVKMLPLPMMCTEMCRLVVAVRSKSVSIVGKESPIDVLVNL